MIRLSRAVVVEGRYDKARLSAILDAPILQTDGFGVFRDKEKRALIRRYANSTGIIVLTDSDSAGRLIRAHVRSIAGEAADVVNLYIPKIRGKEKRKSTASKEGLIGVEGMDLATLQALFEGFLRCEGEEKEPLTRSDLYEWGLFGASDCAALRARVLRHFSLPEDLGVHALLDAANFLYGKEAFLEGVERVLQREKKE